MVHGSRPLGAPRSTSWPSWRQQVHDLDMKSRVHPKYKTKYQSADFFVQARIVARTREVTRAVVEIKTTVQPDEIHVSVPSAQPAAQSGRTKLTESAFLEQLSESSSPEVVRFAQWVLEQAPAHDLTITWGEGGPLLRYEDAETGHRFTFGKLSRGGTLGEALSK